MNRLKREANKQMGKVTRQFTKTEIEMSEEYIIMFVLI